MPFRSLTPLLKLCAAVIIVLLLIDAALFRSGWYFRVIKPDSTAGSVFGAELAIRHYYEPARKNILVLGNSQIGEGFSAQDADDASGRGDLHFINGSVAGTTPRVWYYLLRKVDPDVNRFAAIALMVDYDIAVNRQDMSNYPLDTSYLIPLVRLSDYDDYPSSFTDADRRERARRAILLPLQALRDDASDLLLHPAARYTEVHRNRKGWLYAIGHYPGRDGKLPQLDIDRETGLPEDWSPVAPDVKARLQDYFHDLRGQALPEIEAANTDYLREWLGRIARRYSARNVPVFVFVAPRGPWHQMLAPVPVATGPVAELAAKGEIIPLAGDAFVNLEQPQYFFDALHMNRDGRALFSRRFAQQVAPLVH
jgi:hypothetical protein